MQTVQPNEHCEYEGCKRTADTLARGRTMMRSQGHPNVLKVCWDHATAVAQEDYPEHTTTCPNCRCHFGVG